MRMCAFWTVLGALLLWLAPVTAQPDVIVGDLPSMGNYNPNGTVDSFAVGTESCNIGDEVLDWVELTDQHPVIGQNMYRLKDGRFEQVGMSWLKHGYFAVQDDLCEQIGDDDPDTGYPDCIENANGAGLGVGCSDLYGAGLNGDQGSLGPRWEVNPATGEFPFPYDSPPFSGSVARRIQVHLDDLDPDLNEDAIYIVEGQYVHPDETGEERHNNASYAEITITEPDPVDDPDDYRAAVISATTRELPAIYAWQDADEDVVIETIDIDDDGRFHVGYRVTDNADGTYHYEFALHNLNSERAGGSFSVPLPSGVTISNIGFHDVDYHSGEPFETTDWEVELTGNAITWRVVGEWDYLADREDDTANALRWGTIYNFRFDADADSVNDDLTLGLYKTLDGEDAEVTFSGVRPAGDVLDENLLGVKSTHTGAEVHLCWVNDGAFTSIEVHRDGELLETLDGEAFSFLDTDADAGERSYNLMAFDLDENTAAGRGIVDVPDAPAAGFEYTVNDVSGTYDTSGNGTFTVEIAFGEHEDNASYPNQVDGFSMAIGHDTAYLDAVDVNMSDDLAAVNDGDGPDFFSGLVWLDGVSIGALVDFELSTYLEVDESPVIATVEYDTVPFDLTDLAGAATVITWVDGIGSPEITNYVQIGTDSYEPNYYDGVVSLERVEAQQFLRGDADGNGVTFPILDALFTLEYGFTNGPAPPCEDAGDADDNGVFFPILDALFLLEYGFTDGPMPPDPGVTDCGVDPTPDTTGCEVGSEGCN